MPGRAPRHEKNAQHLEPLESRLLLTVYGPWASFTTFNQQGAIFGNNIAFNQYVPLDPSNGLRSITGCVPTAEAQLMYYWQFPSQLVLSQSDAYSYQVGNTTVNVDGSSAALFFPTINTINVTLAQIDYSSPNEIATLIFALGILDHARYTASNTSSAISAGALGRIGFQSADQSTNWAAAKPQVIANLKVGQPVLLGIGGTANHEVVLDGYNDLTGLFHVKFGWGGYQDGWYDPTSMNVAPYFFNKIDQIIYNIKPTLDIPTGLSATATQSGTVNLAWSPVAGVKGYQVFRSTTNDVNTATRIGPSTITATSYTDTTATNAPYATYYYWVRAVTSIGTGSFSIAASSKVSGTTTLTGLGAAPVINYGTASITLAGVLAAGPTPVPNGKTVKITINGVSKTTTTANGDGSFSLVFPTNTMNAGSYTIIYEYAGDSLFSAVTSSTRKLTIKALALTVTGISALDKIYDATTAATLNTAGKALVGILPGDTVTLNSNAAIGTFSSKNIGTDKTVSITGLALSGADATNYTIAALTALADITPRPITITANDLDKPYGAADPKFAWQVTLGSLAGSDTLTGNLSREKGTHVGTYAISQGTLKASTNYLLSFVGANLIIHKALLTITATNKTMTFGGVIPKLTATYKGFMVGDTVSTLEKKPTVETLAIGTSSVNAGPYNITASGALDSDYSFVYVPGVLTILQAASTTSLQITPAAPVFGQPITLTAIVKSSRTKLIPRVGTVTFFDGTIQLGAPVALDANSSAAITITPSTVGVHKYKAVYTSDGNWKNSTSSVVVRNVGKTKTAIVVVPSLPSPLGVAQHIDLVATATVLAPGVNTPTGLVTFRDGTKVIGTATLDNAGVATLANISFTKIGTHRITAVYAGDLNDRLATSRVLLILVA